MGDYWLTNRDCVSFLRLTRNLKKSIIEGKVSLASGVSVLEGACLPHGDMDAERIREGLESPLPSKGKSPVSYCPSTMPHLLKVLPFPNSAKVGTKPPTCQIWGTYEIQHNQRPPSLSECMLTP